VRNAFLALLFGNLAYFAWAHWVDAPRPAPANDAIARLPRLKLADELPPTQRPEAGAAEKTALSQPAACMSLGPFGDLANSAQAAALLRANGFNPRQRAEQGQMSKGYWVFVGRMTSAAEIDRTLTKLEHNGINDATVMLATQEAEPRLSLGFYSERGRADRRAQAVQRIGLKAEVAERKLPGAVYWLDVVPPPGMSTIALQNLFAEGVRSRTSVQPCPVTAQAAQPSPPAAPGLPTHGLSRASPPPTQGPGAPKLP
jgi:hypothetical protein